MIHLDLFSGIGGFALAADRVFGNVRHVFCDTEPFCRAVIQKHWPGSKIYDDIRQIGLSVADPYRARLEGKNTKWPRGDAWIAKPVDLLTGGFPCQPFSAAGLRRGTDDERHLWPEMLRVIRLTKPTWVVAENVRGLVNWNDGVVFEQVCADLEANGYEVQPFIIPAVAVNAPHRRDRVWFVANAAGVAGGRGTPGQDGGAPSKVQKRHQVGEPAEPNPLWAASNPQHHGQHGAKNSKGVAAGTDPDTAGPHQPVQPARPSGVWSELGYSWESDWTTVAARLCSVDDGLPAELGGLKLTKAQHRNEQIKAYGNAIVPQVAMQIMQAIKEAEYGSTRMG